jgi:hypothetical protein
VTSTLITRASQRSGDASSQVINVVLLISTDSVVRASTARPPNATINKPRTRSRIGLRRLLRGTDHAMLVAFCTAVPRPIAPYVAARAPTTTAAVEPVRPSGLRNWSPRTGNWLRAESSTRCWSSGSPCSRKPRIEVASSRSGKIAKRA